MPGRTRKPLPSEQPVVNAERGEHELVLAGTTFRMRPSFTALVAIEKKTGKTGLELVRLGNAGGIPALMLGTIAAELIRAGAQDEMTRAVDAERLGEMIFEDGIPQATARLTLALADAVTGGRTASGEAKAAAAAD